MPLHVIIIRASALELGSDITGIGRAISITETIGGTRRAVL